MVGNLRLRTLPGLALVVLVGLLPIASAQAELTVLFVDTAAQRGSAGDLPANCTLGDAIAAANGDAAVDGCTAPELGSGGPFEIVLPTASGPYVLTAADSAGTDGALGLPAVGAVVAIVGNGNTVERDPALVCPDAGGADFRILEVGRSGDLSIEALELRNGCAARGGAVYNAGALALQDVVVSGSTAFEGDGGGVLSAEAVLDVHRSTLRDNRATGIGGGIFNFIDSDLTLSDSTLSNNEAERGGGLENLQGRATLFNSTVSQNLADTGGGIGNSGGGVLALVNATVAANDAPLGGDGVVNVAGSITMVNTLMSDRCLFLRNPGSVDGGHNLERRNNSCALTETSSQFGVDPLIGSLRDNGGSTETHVLLAGSPAIDAGNAAECAGIGVGAVDQRGVTRPDGDALFGGVCDIGAVEFADCDENGLDDGAEIADDGSLDLDGDGLLDVCANEPPVADAGPDQIVECTSPAGGLVTLDSSGTFDPDGDAILLYWRSNAGRARGLSASFELPVGAQTVSLFVGDMRGAVALDSMEAVVEDTAPPTATASLEPVSGRADAFLVRLSCADVCDAEPSVSGTVEGVAVSDGDVYDVALLGGAETGQLVLDATCDDGSGNRATAQATAFIVRGAGGSVAGYDDDADDDDDEDDREDND